MGSLVCCGWVGFGNCVLGLVGWGCCGWFLGGGIGEDLIFGWWGYNSPSGLSSVWLRCFLLGVDLVGLAVGFCVFPGFGGFLCASVA